MRVIPEAVKRLFENIFRGLFRPRPTPRVKRYSTVTDLARLRGLSISVPRKHAT